MRPPEEDDLRRMAEAWCVPIISFAMTLKAKIDGKPWGTIEEIRQGEKEANETFARIWNETRKEIPELSGDLLEHVCEKVLDFSWHHRKG
jgi:hypothetical protein